MGSSNKMQTIAATMSFNPYQTDKEVPKTYEEEEESDAGHNDNDTQMSGNQAFMAFLTKTDDQEEEDDE